MPQDFAGLEIRQLRMRELPQFLAFQAVHDYKALPGGGERQPFLSSLLKTLWHGDRIATFIAVREGEIIGYATLVFGKYRTFRGNAYLVGTAVRESERGKGIGSRLFAYAEDHARLRGARRIECEVFAKNVRALELYKRLGYEVEGVKRRAVEYGNECDDLIFMAKFVERA